MDALAHCQEESQILNKQDINAMIDLRLREMIAGYISISNVKNEHLCEYSDHLDILVEEVKKYADFKLALVDECIGWELAVSFNKSLSHVDKFLEEEGITIPNDPSLGLEIIIEAVMKAKNTHKFLQQ